MRTRLQNGSFETKYNKDNFIEKIKEVHGDTYDYKFSEFNGYHSKIDILCKIHGKFSQPLRDHLKGRGCTLCGRKRCSDSKLKTKEYFITKAREIYGDKYDYSKIIYTGQNCEVIIICPEHGEFKLQARTHISQRGECPECQKKILRNKNKNEFLQKAKEKHGNKYDYSLITDYKHNYEPLPIICPIHGIQMQPSASHLHGSGCKRCGDIITGQKLAFSISEYVEKANIVHNNKYDYSKAIYTNAGSKIEIICPDHGVFWQNPNNHLKGCECPKCNSNFSKIEDKWLESINIPKSNRRVFFKIDGKFIYADGYDKTTNTIYEFNGDFWHGNPKIYNPNDINKASKKTFGELYRKTIEREDFLKKNGYNIVVMWECDFRELLKNKLIK